jgi:hypothetical protein
VECRWSPDKVRRSHRETVEYDVTDTNGVQHQPGAAPVARPCGFERLITASALLRHHRCGQRENQTLPAAEWERRSTVARLFFLSSLLVAWSNRFTVIDLGDSKRPVTGTDDLKTRHLLKVAPTEPPSRTVFVSVIDLAKGGCHGQGRYGGSRRSCLTAYISSRAWREVRRLPWDGNSRAQRTTGAHSRVRASQIAPHLLEVPPRVKFPDAHCRPAPQSSGVHSCSTPLFGN